jgi:hypothetical protein
MCPLERSVRYPRHVDALTDLPGLFDLSEEESVYKRHLRSRATNSAPAKAAKAVPLSHDIESL